MHLKIGNKFQLPKNNFKMEIIPNMKWKMEIKVQLQMKMKIQLVNENPIRKWKSNLKIKIKDHLKIGQKSPISPKWWIKKNEIQLENVNENSSRKY